MDDADKQGGWLVLIAWVVPVWALFRIGSALWAIVRVLENG